MNVSGQEIDWRAVEKSVFKLQKRIYQASQAKDEVLVRKLQKLLKASYAAKLLAIRKVTQLNQGRSTAGVDGKVALTPKTRKQLSDSLNWELRTQPIRRVWIEKPGKAEKRPLGIPTIRERVRQTIISMVLEPEWEAKFEPNSYGFRPGRSCHDAIQAIFQSVKFKQAHVLDADIKGCFDNIGHQALLDKLNNSHQIKRLIGIWLKAGVMDNGFAEVNKSGTPQGSSLSPLLANIALHGMENDTKAYLKQDLIRYNKNRWGKQGSYLASISIIRYADDFVILHESEEIILKAKAYITDWLKGLELELKPEKTRIAHTLHRYKESQPGFKFLGFSIRQFKCSDRAKGYKTIIRPDKEKVKIHRRKLNETVRNHRSLKQEELIRILNPVIRGWCNYNQYAVSRQTFESLQNTMFRIIWSWACYRHSYRSKKWIKEKYFIQDGGNNWRFGLKNGVKLVSHADCKITRFTKVSGNNSPYNGDFVYWATRMGKYREGMKTAAILLKKQKGKCCQCNLNFLPDDNFEVLHLNGDKKDFKGKNLKLIHGRCTGKMRGMQVKHYVTEEPDARKRACPVLKPSTGGDTRA
jgi:RNA-directed DNA polymerase